MTRILMAALAGIELPAALKRSRTNAFRRHAARRLSHQHFQADASIAPGALMGCRQSHARAIFCGIQSVPQVEAPP